MALFEFPLRSLTMSAQVYYCMLWVRNGHTAVYQTMNYAEGGSLPTKMRDLDLTCVQLSIDELLVTKDSACVC